MSGVSSLRGIKFREIPMPEVKTPRDKSVKEEVDKLYLEKCQEVNQLTEKLRGMDKRAAFLEGKLAERSRELTDCKEELNKLKEAQDGDLISRAEAIKAVEATHNVIFMCSDTMDDKTLREIAKHYDDVAERTVKLISEIPAVSGLSAAERLHEEVEELWQDEHMKGLAAEAIADMGKSAKKVGETIKELLCEFKETAETVELQEGYLEQTVTAQEILCLSSALRNLYEIHKCDGWLLYNKLSRVLDRAVDEYSKELGGVE